MNKKTKKYLNFSPGPSIIADWVIEKTKDDFANRLQSGFSVIETSHRGSHFLKIKEEAELLVRKLLHLDKTTTKFHILFTQGGASMEFLRVAANLLTEEKVLNTEKQACYIDSGFWVQKAHTQAAILAKSMPTITTKPNIVSSSAKHAYRYIPKIDVTQHKNSSYIYLCSNNTIAGTQYGNFSSFSTLNTSKTPLICDATSNLFAKEISPNELEKFGIIFAGTQKNLGTAGLSLVLIRSDVLKKLNALEETNKLILPTMLSYAQLLKHEGLFNTPNVFAINMLRNTLYWLDKNGGVAAIEALNKKKSSLIYNVVNSYSIYKPHVTPTSPANASGALPASMLAAADPSSQPSIVNMVFHLKKQNKNSSASFNKQPPTSLEEQFLLEASEENMHGLRGHKLLGGGVRASMYNAFPYSGAQQLADFMEKFAKKNG